MHHRVPRGYYVVTVILQTVKFCRTGVLILTYGGMDAETQQGLEQQKIGVKRALISYENHWPCGQRKRPELYRSIYEEWFLCRG